MQLWGKLNFNLNKHEAVTTDETIIFVLMLYNNL